MRNSPVSAALTRPGQRLQHTRQPIAGPFYCAFCAVHRSAIHSAFQRSSAVRRSRLWAGVRVQRHRDDKRGPALRSLYNNLCPHLLGQKS